MEVVDGEADGNDRSSDLVDRSGLAQTLCMVRERFA